MAYNVRFYADIMEPPAEVTGSFNLVILKAGDETVKFAIDCGLYQEEKYDEQNFSFPTKPEELDFVVLTHNHCDHNGRLPLLVKQGFKGPIFTTVPTSYMLGKALNDNLHVLKDTSKRQNLGPMYDDIDVAQTLKQLAPCEYLEPVQANKHVELHFLYNGHLLGAASVLVRLKNTSCRDFYILFSGDYNNKNMFFDVPPIRDWIKELPNLVVVCESTYGLMDSTEIEPVFENNILNALQDGCTCIVPAFSLGRSQEVLWTLKDMQERHPDIMGDTRIFFDGKLAFAYTDMYKKMLEDGVISFFRDKEDFLPKDLIRVDNKEMRRDHIEDYKPKIIVTTSGMGSYGPAQTYIPAFMKSRKALIHFTGYCAEGTLGYRLKNTEVGSVVQVGGLDVIKKGNVEFTKEFTAHAKADELITFLRQFRNLNTVLINHGSYEAKHAFAKRVLMEVDPCVVGVLGEDWFYRINADGFDKQMGTKFK